MSSFSSTYHDYVSTICSAAGVIAVSVEYGLFPTRPIPACYEDSRASLQWVATHVNGTRPDQWLNEYADLNRIFVGGDSTEGTNDEMWLYINKENEGVQDRRLKLAAEDLRTVL